MLAATVCPSDVPSCSGLLDINLTLVVELAIFLVMCYVLWRLVWRPIIDVLERRDQRLAAGQRAAAEAERRYNDGLAEVQATLDRARTEARDIVAEAYRGANARAEEVRAEAHAQARALADEALTQIRAESEAAVASLREQARGLAVLAASRLLRTDLDERRFATVAAKAIAE